MTIFFSSKYTKEHSPNTLTVHAQAFLIISWQQAFIGHLKSAT